MDESLHKLSQACTSSQRLPAHRDVSFSLSEPTGPRAFLPERCPPCSDLDQTFVPSCNQRSRSLLTTSFPSHSNPARICPNSPRPDSINLRSFPPTLYSRQIDPIAPPNAQSAQFVPNHSPSSSHKPPHTPSSPPHRPSPPPPPLQPAPPRSYPDKRNTRLGQSSTRRVVPDSEPRRKVG